MSYDFFHAKQKCYRELEGKYKTCLVYHKYFFLSLFFTFFISFISVLSRCFLCTKDQKLTRLYIILINQTWIKILLKTINILSQQNSFQGLIYDYLK